MRITLVLSKIGLYMLIALSLRLFIYKCSASVYRFFCNQPQKEPVVFADGITNILLIVFSCVFHNKIGEC